MTTAYYERAKIKRYKRQMEVKRNTIILLTAISLVLIIKLFSMNTINSVASDSGRVVNYKYYKSVEIQKGDTLWSIAEDNIDYNQYESINDYIKEIKQMNSLKSNSIKAGNYIIIPYYSTEFH